MPSLREINRTIPVPKSFGFWRKLLAFSGPGFLIAVGYMDPGNWATDLAGGSAFGYTLLSVILLSNLMAILLQTLAARLGIVTGRDLAQACRDHYSPPAVREPGHTTHYSVVDAEGNAVSVTTTLNDDFGSRVTAAGLGFLLNDEMDDFASKPGTPNVYGLIQGPANAIGPGKRPLSSMTPTMVVRDGHLFLVLGSPGGARIISTVANILIGVVDYGMDIQEAVNAPRFHQQWLPDEVRVEQWFSPDTVKSLQRMGYKIEFGEQDEGSSWEPRWSDGECIAIDPKTGERLGASDERNNGKAVGF